MFDRDSLENDINNSGGDDNPYQDNNYAFGFMSCTGLKDGSYKMRVCPPEPKRNPKGYMKMGTHKVTIAGETKKFLARGAFEDPAMASDYMDRLKKRIEAAEISKRVGKEIRKQLADLWGKWVYRFVTLWYAESYIQEVTKNGVTTEYRNYRPVDPNNPEAVPIGLIWDVSAEGLMKQIVAISQTYPDFSAHNMGRWLTFTKKGTKYTITAHENKEPLSQDLNDFIGSNYPDLCGFRDNLKLSGPEIMNYIKQAPFAEVLRHYGVSLEMDDASPGIYVPPQPQQQAAPQLSAPVLTAPAFTGGFDLSAL